MSPTSKGSVFLGCACWAGVVAVQFVPKGAGELAEGFAGGVIPGVKVSPRRLRGRDLVAVRNGRWDKGDGHAGEEIVDDERRRWRFPEVRSEEGAHAGAP